AHGGDGGELRRIDDARHDVMRDEQARGARELDAPWELGDAMHASELLVRCRVPHTDEAVELCGDARPIRRDRAYALRCGSEGARHLSVFRVEELNGLGVWSDDD